MQRRDGADKKGWLAQPVGQVHAGVGVGRRVCTVLLTCVRGSKGKLGTTDTGGLTEYVGIVDAGGSTGSNTDLHCTLPLAKGSGDRLRTTHRAG